MKTERERITDTLLPDQLEKLWQSVEAKQLSPEEFEAEQNRLLDEYKQTWTQALLLDGQKDLKESLLREVSIYTGCDDLAETERRCRQGGAGVKKEWETTFRPGEWQTAEQFYDESQAYMYELMWWHNLL